MNDIDLSGRWSGFYGYPAGRPPVPFEAELKDQEGRITGATSEADEVSGETICAVLDGRRSGRSVSFAKLYERADENYDSVHYSGEISADGDEISGQWHIPGNWSGTFLMIRAGRSKAEVAEEVSERV